MWPPILKNGLFSLRNKGKNKKKMITWMLKVTTLCLALFAVEKYIFQLFCKLSEHHL